MKQVSSSRQFERVSGRARISRSFQTLHIIGGEKRYVLDGHVVFSISKSHITLSMKHSSKYCFLFLMLVCISNSYASEKDILAILSLPEDKIDIGIAALTIAKDVFPDLDIKAYSAKIDAMVTKARMLTKGSTDPDYRVRALNTYLYKREGIRFDLSDPDANNLQNRFLNGILDTKKGSCVTMPLLYVAIAQRLGYPVFAVPAPWHYFLRYVDPKLKMQNIETTSGGGYSPDEEYIETMQVSKRALKSGAYLRTISYRELVADRVADCAIYWAKQGDMKRAIKYLEKCAKVYPKSPEINLNLGKAYWFYSKGLVAGEAEAYRQKGEFYIKKADELGLTKLSNSNYIEEQKKAQEKYRKKQKP